MTQQEQLQCVADTCDAFKQVMHAKAPKIPGKWDGMEIRQWVMDCAKNAWVNKMPVSRMRAYQHARTIHNL